MPPCFVGFLYVYDLIVAELFSISIEGRNNQHDQNRCKKLRKTGMFTGI